MRVANGEQPEGEHTNDSLPDGLSITDGLELETVFQARNTVRT